MKFFDVRQTGEAATGTPWPASAPALRLLDMAPLLQVPLATRQAVEPAGIKPVGSFVSKGEPLCHRTIEGTPVILAPTSGRISGMRMIRLLNGCEVPALDLEPDSAEQDAIPDVHDSATSQEHHELTQAMQTVQSSDLATWIDGLRDAGIWADRRASPDFLLQLHKLLSSPVDTLICNLLDDEPTMRLSSTLASRAGPLLLAGVRLLAKLTEAKKVFLVTEASAPGKWLSPLRKLARHDDIDFVPLVNDYPQSDPTMLAYTLTRRRLKPGSSPVEQRIMLLDAATSVAIGRFVMRQHPMLRVPFAVRDHINRRTHLLVVPIGTSLRHVLAQVEAPVDDVTLRRGDILHENDVTADAIIAGGDLTVHVLPKQVAPLSDPCIRCSWCIESCPTRIQPAGLLEAAQRDDLALANRYGIHACIECGVCTYVCPSRLPLLVGIRRLKEVLKSETQPPNSIGGL